MLTAFFNALATMLFISAMFNGIGSKFILGKMHKDNATLMAKFGVMALAWVWVTGQFTLGYYLLQVA